MRHVKGLNLRGIVRGLATAKHLGVSWANEDLGEGRKFLEGERVVAAAWYPLPVFLQLLILYHRLCFTGTDSGAIRLGYLGAKLNAESAHGPGIQKTPSAMVASFPRLWRQNFDFGALETQVDGSQATVHFRAYDDIGRVHGLLHVGWFRALCELSGAARITSKTITTPWEHHDALCIELRWSHESSRPASPGSH
jgi:hypothetical protein